MVSWRLGMSLLAMWYVAGVAHAQTYWLPPDGVNVIGELRRVYARQEDTFSDIARRYNVGFNELVLSNPTVDPWVPGEGTEIVLPTVYILPDAPREGLVLNVPEMRIYYFPKPKPGEKPVVITHPVSIGRVEWNTPFGRTTVVKKQANPHWFPPESVRAEHAADGDTLPKSIPPGPDNPLGAYALRLGIPGYLIHGTNRPYGVGMRVTHGCVRLYPEDIRSLFEKIDVGTAVQIVNQPYKAGWRNGVLYFEAHPGLEEDKNHMTNNFTPAVRAVVAVNPEDGAAVDWNRVRELVEHSRGVPEAIAALPLDRMAVDTPMMPVKLQAASGVNRPGTADAKP